MAPTRSISPRSSRLIYTIFSASHSIFSLLRGSNQQTLVKRENPDFVHGCRKSCIAFAVLIPILVLLSGLFAGLTLGYFSLDQTQLNVLSVSGTPEQQKYARKIQPIRKNGHLLLVTLLLANMIVNESLPILADPVLGGGVQSVVVSTVLIVIFAEIIPQSLFTRHGLYLGAKGAPLTKALMYILGIVAWPVAKLLDFILGSNHGIIYRRAELKELIAMHSNAGRHGGDLQSDTVTIIGATLDLQEKVVRQAMTPIEDVFMLHIDDKLDYDLLKKIVASGHSRVPIFSEVDLPESYRAAVKNAPAKAQKILGILLVKQCVLLDPKDATPIRSLQLNKVPHVPNNESLLGLLDKFQEGRSHMAIVSRVSVEKAKSVKKAVKRGLTQRLRERVGMGDSSDSDSSSEEEDRESLKNQLKDGDETLKGDGVWEKDFVKKSRRRKKQEESQEMELEVVNRTATPVKKLGSFQISNLEQNMPADAVLAEKEAEEFLIGFDPTVHPLGIITLEDVLEELIGEEIYDEFDAEGAHGEPILNEHPHQDQPSTEPAVTLAPNKSLAGMKSLSFFRSRSAPPQDRQDGKVAKPGTNTDVPPATEKSASGEAPEPVQSGLNSDSAAKSKTPSPDSGAVPVPTLEAVLLDRKRRLAASGSTNTGGNRGRPTAKGRFKSTPLSVDTMGAARSTESAPPTEVVDHATMEAEYAKATEAMATAGGSGANQTDEYQST